MRMHAFAKYCVGILRTYIYHTWGVRNARTVRADALSNCAGTRHALLGHTHSYLFKKSFLAPLTNYWISWCYAKFSVNIVVIDWVALYALSIT